MCTYGQCTDRIHVDIFAISFCFHQFLYVFVVYIVITICVWNKLTDRRVYSILLSTPLWMNDESPYFQRIIVYSIIDLVFVLPASSRTMFQLSNQVKSNLYNLHNCHGFSTFYLGPLHLECCISQFVTIGGTVIRSHILIQVCAHFNLVKSRCPRLYLLIEPCPKKVTCDHWSRISSHLFLWCNRIHCIRMEWQDLRKQQSHGRTWVWPARNMLQFSVLKAASSLA